MNKLYIYTFLLIISIYLLSSSFFDVSGGIYNDLFVTRNLLKDKKIYFQEMPYDRDFSQGKNGKYYAIHDIGHSLFLLLPASSIRCSLRLLDNLGIQSGENIRNFIAYLFLLFWPAFYSALTCIITIKICLLLKIKGKIALLTGILLAFATPLYVYSKSTLSTSLITMLQIIALYFCLKFTLKKDKLIYLATSGFLFALLITTRITTLATLTATLVYLIWKLNRQNNNYSFLAKAMAIFILACLPGIAWLIFYNFIRTGSIFLSPLFLHPANKLSSNLVPAVTGLLVSPGKGLIFFSPLSILAIFGIGRFVKYFKAEAALIFSILVLTILSHSLHTNWPGGYSWGPRYLIPLLPLIMIPIALLLNSGVLLILWKKISILCLSLISLGVQLVGISVQWHYLSWSLAYQLHLDKYGMWDVRYCLLRFATTVLPININNLLIGKPDCSAFSRFPIEERLYEIAGHKLNFWWVIYTTVGIPKSIIVAIALPLLGLFLFSLLKIVLLLKNTGNETNAF